jgi:hypothetical protein
MKKSEIQKNINESIEMLKYIAESMVNKKQIKFVDISRVLPDFDIDTEESPSLGSVYFEIKYRGNFEIWDADGVRNATSDILQSYDSFISTVNFDSEGNLTDKKSMDSSLGMITNIQYSMFDNKGYEMTISSDITTVD